ncbi:MAG TPA: hypothetical protein VMH35_12990 [Streptosporangiaceae bacterium]|nr:hypothetical protein [Streptosporangiaceae bacterium]
MRSSVKNQAPQHPDLPVMLRITLSGAVDSGHIRARPRRGLFRPRRVRP